MEDIKKELKKEIYEQKKIGNSASHKAGRSRKKMKMPFEMMSKEERRKYMAPSEVVTYKMQPMTLGEFKKTPGDRQLELLKWYGEKYGWSLNALATVLSISRPTARKILDEFRLSSMYAARLGSSTKEQKKAQKERLNALRQERQLTLDPEKEPTSVPVDENPTTPEESQKPSQAILAAPMDMFLVGLKSKRLSGASLAGCLRGIAESLDADQEYQVSLSVQFPDGDQRVSNVKET